MAIPEKIWHLWFLEFQKTDLQLAPPYISGYSCIIRPEPKHTASLYTSQRELFFDFGVYTEIISGVFPTV